MKMRRRVIVAALLLAVSLAGVHAQDSTASADQRIVALERQKWTPQSFKSPEDLMALFADDFVSVEYGADVTGGVQRKSRAEVFSGPPLPPATFDLADFKVVHPTTDSAVVSYKVTATSFKWQAYATSVWARRNGKWVTVFYQASTTGQ